MIFPEFVAFRYWLSRTPCCQIAFNKYGRRTISQHEDGTYHLWGYID